MKKQSEASQLFEIILFLPQEYKISLRYNVPFLFICTKCTKSHQNFL